MGRRGVALIYFLIVMSVVVLLITTIFVTTKRQLFTTTASINSVRAHYVAEAGLAAAIARLEEDPGWTDGFDQEPMPEGPGTYSLRFSSDPITAGPDRSLNNLNSLSALDSYHGANTLPPFSALLVVEGEVGLEKRVLEAVVVLGADVPERSAILASDTITISGGASIDGRLSEHDTDSIPVDVHSNSTASGALVDLTAIDSSGNFISGRATSSGESDASTSVLMPAGGGAAGGTASKLAPKKMPDPNITAILEQHQSEAGPPIPVVPGPLSLSGNNYYSGDVTIQGDLYLENDAKLFVQGDLKINGSIRGHGALVVGGNTVLHGSADLTPGENDFVSLMSGGHVVMEGFNGQEYLENLRDTDPAARKKLEDMEFAIQEMQSFLPLFDESGSQPMNSDRTFNQRIDGLQAIVSNHPWAEHFGHRDTFYSGREPRTADRLREDHFSGYAEGTVENFLDQKFLTISDLFRDARYDREGNSPYPVDYIPPDHSVFLWDYDDWDRENLGGFVDCQVSFNDADTPEHQAQLRQMRSVLIQTDFDRLGSAEFKGVVYAEGGLLVTDDINVLGTVIVNGKPGVEDLDVGGFTVKSGQVTLKGNSRILFVEDMVKQGLRNLSGVGTLDIKRLVSR